jgi:hypothetical protein
MTSSASSAFAAVFLTLFGAWVPLTAVAQAPPTAAERGSLDVLHSRTNWILLGELSRDLKHRAAGADPAVDFKTGSYEVINRKVDRRRPGLPRVGDRIRLTARNAVTILDYATAGEKRVLQSPSSVRRHLGVGDRPGIVLPADSVVEVRDVKISRPYGHVRVVWARISPVRKR